MEDGANKQTGIHGRGEAGRQAKASRGGGRHVNSEVAVQRNKAKHGLHGCSRDCGTLYTCSVQELYNYVISQ